MNQVEKKLRNDSTLSLRIEQKVNFGASKPRAFEVQAFIPSILIALQQLNQRKLACLFGFQKFMEKHKFYAYLFPTDIYVIAFK